MSHCFLGKSYGSSDNGGVLTLSFYWVSVAVILADKQTFLFGLFVDKGIDKAVMGFVEKLSEY